MLVRVLQQNLPYADSLDSSFFNAIIRGEQRINLTQDGYEMYKNAGFDAIRSKVIKKKIVILFEEKYKNLNEWRIYLNQLAPFDQEFWISNFLQYENGFKPLNYKLIIDDISLQNQYYSVQRTRERLRKLMTESQIESEAVLALLKEELIKF